MKIFAGLMSTGSCESSSIYDDDDDPPPPGPYRVEPTLSNSNKTSETMCVKNIAKTLSQPFSGMTKSKPFRK